MFRWEVVPVDAAKAESTAEALEAAVKALADARDQAEGRPLAARLMVSCGDAVYRQITENLEQFRFDVVGQAAGDVWVEKIKLAITGEEQAAEPTFSEDAISELRSVLAELRADPDSVRAALAAGDCGKLKKLLPADVRDVFESNRDEIIDQAAMHLRTRAAEEGA